MSIEDVKEAFKALDVAKVRVDKAIAATYDEGQFSIPQIADALGYRGRAKFYTAVRKYSRTGLRGYAKEAPEIQPVQGLQWEWINERMVHITASEYEIEPGRFVNKVGMFDLDDEMPDILLEEIYHAGIEGVSKA